MTQYIPKTTQPPTSNSQPPASDPQSEISCLQHYVEYVRQAASTAPDGYTRMIRTWVLILAEAELACTSTAMEKRGETFESEKCSSRLPSFSPSASNSIRSTLISPPIRSSFASTQSSST